ncbi:MAG: hypothetical protein WBA28_00995 [Microbacteriaceae bacterium]
MKIVQLDDPYFEGLIDETPAYFLRLYTLSGQGAAADWADAVLIQDADSVQQVLDYVQTLLSPNHQVEVYLVVRDFDPDDAQAFLLYSTREEDAAGGS